MSELVPYPNNPRINSGAVAQVAESIKQTGNLDPIEIDENNVILSGHTRLKALTKLGYTETECVRYTGLTDEQKRKYRLLANKTGEAALWDMDRLLEELEGLDFDGIDFDWGLPEEDEEDIDGYYGDEREKTYNAVNLNEYDEERTAGKYQIPTLVACNFVPDKLIGFNYVKTAKEFDCGVHFFLDDYQFERIWNSPHEIIPRLAKFDCVFTPDFSLYLDMPVAMKIWNTYRARLIGQMMQDAGYNVIPTVSWADEASFEYCFDGIPQHGSIAVSTVGVMRSAEARELYAKGLTEALKRLKPNTVICYGSKIDFDFGKTNVKFFAARQFGG